MIENVNYLALIINHVVILHTEINIKSKTKKTIAKSQLEMTT